jgi:hypothetical protein
VMQLLGGWKHVVMHPGQQADVRCCHGELQPVGTSRAAQLPVTKRHVTSKRAGVHGSTTVETLTGQLQASTTCSLICWTKSIFIDQWYLSARLYYLPLVWLVSALNLASLW